MVRGQENKDCKFNEFNLFSLSKERLTDDIITVYKYLHGENTFDNQGFFSSTDKDITKCGRWMLKLEKFQFKGISFMKKMVNLWNNLTRIMAKLYLWKSVTQNRTSFRKAGLDQHSGSSQFYNLRNTWVTQLFSLLMFKWIFPICILTISY